MKKVLWIVQLGTPAALTEKACGEFLREFLSDPRVINLPGILRWPLVNCVIVPFRKSKSFEAYKQIWKKEGSPLRIYTEDLVRVLQEYLKAEVHLEWSMRYGAPSMRQSFKKIQAMDPDQVLVMPLFPHYSLATTESVFDELNDLSKELGPLPTDLILNFYQEEFFLRGVVARAEPFHVNSYDRVLFSYHGLPLSVINCSTPENCGSPQDALCYRTQCFETSRLVGERLQVSSDRLITCFQSRLGVNKWIGPYTDEVLKSLPQAGVKKILVFSPSFTADCLETLEEMGLRNRELFLQSGGEQYDLVPCVNADRIWAGGLAQWALQKLR